MFARVHATFPRRVYVLIESLESRRLLSAHIEYGDWYIDGTDVADQLIIQPKPSDAHILQAILNGATYEAPLDSLDDIRISLLAGDDQLTFKLGNLAADDIYISGGPGNDTLSGSSHYDYIDGGAGDDLILGHAGDDNLNGGPGNDTLYGGFGADRLSGQLGDDLLLGGPDNDSLEGGAGNDAEFGRRGNDLLAGNTGRDSLNGDDGADILAGGMDDDQLRGGDGSDQLDGSFGADQLWGGNGSDKLHGGPSADQMNGGASADYIYRQSGVDRTISDRSDKLFEEQLNVPLNKSDAATLKTALIDSALNKWSYDLGSKRASYDARRYYDRGPDGKLFQVDPQTGEPVTNNKLSGGCSGGGDYSETNVQEEGVDESDLVKTDGKNLYLLNNNRLIIMNAVPAGDSHILSTTDIEGDASGLYLNGHFVTVISQTSRDIGTCKGYDGGPGLADGETCTAQQTIEQVKVTVFDVSKPGAPIVAEETSLDGSLNTSRMIDGKLYLVLINHPTLPSPRGTWHVEAPLPPDWKGETNDYGSDIGKPGYVDWYGKKYLEQVGGYFEYESAASYRKRLTAMSLDQLAPSYTSGNPGKKPQTGSLLNPATVYAGADSVDQYGYWNMSSIVALNPTDDKSGIDSSAAIVGASGDIYVSRGSLYLASQRYATPMGQWHGEYETDLYKFRLSDKGIDLVANGQAPGTVINSFAMDEEDGRLRIATNSGSWNERSNNIFVLEQHGQSLQVEGGVTGLALNEGIRSARFDGDRGYLVTFLQRDPLFVVDFTDPTKPKLDGELQIPGFSSYLHPIADHRMIGVGQNATDSGSITGLQVSLFDVSDPKNPTRPANFLFRPDDSFDWSESIAESDHHAFAYFPQQGILALPVSSWTDNGYETTAYILRVGKSDITLIGKVPQKGYASRNVRIGDNLYAISSDEVKIVELANPQNQLADIQLPPPPQQTDAPWYPVDTV